jgi:hypothetical protein
MSEIAPLQADTSVRPPLTDTDWTRLSEPQRHFCSAINTGSRGVLAERRRQDDPGGATREAVVDQQSLKSCFLVSADHERDAESGEHNADAHTRSSSATW